jgi:hypothetical protein
VRWASNSTPQGFYYSDWSPEAMTPQEARDFVARLDEALDEAIRFTELSDVRQRVLRFASGGSRRDARRAQLDSEPSSGGYANACGPADEGDNGDNGEPDEAYDDGYDASDEDFDDSYDGDGADDGSDEAYDDLHAMLRDQAIREAEKQRSSHAGLEQHLGRVARERGIDLDELRAANANGDATAGDTLQRMYAEAAVRCSYRGHFG